MARVKGEREIDRREGRRMKGREEESTRLQFQKEIHRMTGGNGNEHTQREVHRYEAMQRGAPFKHHCKVGWCRV